MTYEIRNTKTHETLGTVETLAEASREWLDRGGRPTGWRIFASDGSQVMDRDWSAYATPDAIRSLRTSAGAAGDLAQVSICDRALDGDEAAIVECGNVIADAIGRRD